MMKKLFKNSNYSSPEHKISRAFEGSSFKYIQSNGQRISFLDGADSMVPVKGTEVFVGNLPHDLYEDELIPLFSKIGKIYSVRLMLDFFGRNRGFAFIQYYAIDAAYFAVTNLNNFTVRGKTKIAVCLSVDNRRLFIGNIPKDKSMTEIRSVLVKYVDGIVDVIVYADPYNPVLNRGFVFVEFESHRLAAIARRHLAPGNLSLWGQVAFVDWAEPLPVLSPQITQQVGF